MKWTWVALSLSLVACRERADAPPAPAPAKPSAPVAAKAPAAAPAPDAQVERGRYLAENVLGCVSCHTERDFNRFGGPMTGTPLAGACFGEGWELPGRVCAPNITSDPEHGVGRWTDAELLRALREGFGRDGQVLFPMMPYLEFRALSDSDARAVVAWLRQVPPASRATPRTQMPPEVAEELKGLAAPLTAAVADPGPAPHERGRYLATVAQCAFCHSGPPGPSGPAPFAGGRALPTPHGAEPAPSLLPSPKGVLPPDEDAFVARFTAFRDVAEAPARPGQLNKLVMPWRDFSGLREDDLRALYRYLRTQPAPASAAVVP
jgi:cytochrome c551/c552